jgi:peptidoglycan/LPS O-acetylase OafA/YrhL
MTRRVPPHVTRADRERAKERFVALDGLRGVAALVVVFGHLLGALPIDPDARVRIVASQVPRGTGAWGMLAAGAVCAGLALLAATILETIVEVPAQEVGRRMAKWIDARVMRSRQST